MSRWWLGLGLSLLSLHCTAVEVAVGESFLILPAPQGFVEISNRDREALALAESLTPPMNRLLAVYLSEADVDVIKAGGSPAWRRYMLVQADRQSEPYRVSGTGFREAKDILRSQQLMLQDRVKDQVDRFFAALDTNEDPRTGIKLGQMLPLGVFGEGNRHLSTETLAKYRSANVQAPDDYLVIGATNVVHIGGKVVFAYVYSTYEGAADRDWVQATSHTWSGDIVKANQLVDWARLDPKVLLVVIIGAIVVALFLYTRRRRTPG